MPRLSALHDEYAARGFEAIAINLEEDMETVVKVLARQNTNLYLRDDGFVWTTYRHNNVIPTNYVIDPNGVVTYWEEGFDEMAIRGAIEASLPAIGPAAVAPTRPLRN